MRHGTKKTIDRLYLQADFTKDAQILSLIERASKLSTRSLAILINNAAFFAEDSWENVNPEMMDRHYCINVRGPMLLMQAFFAHVKKNNIEQAQVINIIDASIKTHNLAFPSYHLSKHAFYQGSCMAACAYAPFLRINHIAPGMILKGEHSSDTRSFDTRKKREIFTTSTDDLLKTIHFILTTPSICNQTFILDGTP